MKKMYVGVFLGTLLILMSSVLLYNQFIKDKDSFVTSMPKYMEEVKTVDEFEEIINSRETVYVYVGRQTCGDSERFEAYFENMIVDNNLEGEFVFFNIIDIVEDEENYKEILNDKFDVKYTPTLAKYENGRLVLKSEWTPAYDYTKEMAKMFIEESGISD